MAELAESGGYRGLTTLEASRLRKLRGPCVNDPIQGSILPGPLPLELELVISTAATSLVSLIRTLNEIVAEKPDRRSISLVFRR